MAKTVEIECKKYEEWDEETQEKILDKYRDTNVEGYDWWQYSYEMWAEKLAAMGYDIEDVEVYDERRYNTETGKWQYTGQKASRKTYSINFSGFWSQGDGASFTTNTIYIEEWLRYHNNPKYSRILKLLENNTSSELWYSAKVVRESRYYHERSTTLYINWEPYKVYDMPNIYTLLEQIEKEMEEDIIQLNCEIYKSLQEEYEYLTSDKVVAETLIANEYEFDEDAKRW